MFFVSASFFDQAKQTRVWPAGHQFQSFQHESCSSLKSSLLNPAPSCRLFLSSPSFFLLQKPQGLLETFILGRLSKTLSSRKSLPLSCKNIHGQRQTQTYSFPLFPGPSFAPLPMSVAHTTDNLSTQLLAFPESFHLPSISAATGPSYFSHRGFSFPAVCSWLALPILGPPAGPRFPSSCLHFLPPPTGIPQLLTLTTLLTTPSLLLTRELSLALAWKPQVGSAWALSYAGENHVASESGAINSDISRNPTHQYCTPTTLPPSSTHPVVPHSGYF